MIVKSLPNKRKKNFSITNSSARSWISEPQPQQLIFFVPSLNVFFQTKEYLFLFQWEFPLWFPNFTFGKSKGKYSFTQWKGTITYESIEIPCTFLFSLSLSSAFHLFPRQYYSLYFALRCAKILFNVKLPNCKNARSFCLCRLYLSLVRLNRSFVSHIMIIIQPAVSTKHEKRMKFPMSLE